MEARKLLLPLWGPVFPEVSFPRSLRRQLYNASPILLAPGVHLTPLLSHSGFPLSLHLPGVSFQGAWSRRPRSGQKRWVQGRVENQMSQLWSLPSRV